MPKTSGNKKKSAAKKTKPKVEPKVEPEVESPPESKPESKPVVESKPEPTTAESKPESLPVVESEPLTTYEQFVALAKDIQEMGKVLSGLSKKLKALSKQHNKELSAAKKAKPQKKPKSNAPKGKTGFAAPRPISDHLADFIGVEKGTLTDQITVNRKIHEYIAKNGLQNPENRRNIDPDEKLKALLLNGGPTKEPLSYFNIKRYLKHHYPKSVGKVTVVGAENNGATVNNTDSAKNNTKAAT